MVQEIVGEVLEVKKSDIKDLMLEKILEEYKIFSTLKDEEQKRYTSFIEEIDWKNLTSFQPSEKKSFFIYACGKDKSYRFELEPTKVDVIGVFRTAGGASYRRNVLDKFLYKNLVLVDVGMGKTNDDYMKVMSNMCNWKELGRREVIAMIDVLSKYLISEGDMGRLKAVVSL